MKTLELIKITDVEKTYNGETGCACGCGGSYAYPTEKDLATVVRRVNLINKAIESDPTSVEVDAHRGTVIYELALGAKRVTRVYVNVAV